MNGPALRAIRAKKQLTYRQVADAVGLSESDIWDFERGVAEAVPDLQERLEAFFQVCPGYLSSPPVRQYDRIFTGPDSVVLNDSVFRARQLLADRRGVPVGNVRLDNGGLFVCSR